MARAEKRVKFTRSIFKSGGSYRTTIPMEIIRTLNIKETDLLEIWIDDSQIILQKKE